MSYNCETKAPDGSRLASPEGFGLFDVKKMKTLQVLLKAVVGTLQLSGDGITESTEDKNTTKDSGYFTIKCSVSESPQLDGNFKDSAEKQCVCDIATILAETINSFNISMKLSNLHVQSSDSGDSIDTILKFYLKIEDLQNEIDKLERYAIQADVESAIEAITEKFNSFLEKNTQAHGTFTNEILAIKDALSSLETENTSAIKNLNTKLGDISILVSGIEDIAELASINATKLTNHETRLSELTTRVTKCEVDIQTLFQYADDGKNLIAVAITGKGVPASKTDTFQVLANKISQIETGGGSSGSVDLTKLKLTSREYSQADPATNICFNNSSGTWKKMARFTGKGILFFEEVGAMGRDCCEPDFEGEGSFRVIVDDTKYISIGGGESVAFEKSLEIQCEYSLSSHSCWGGDNDPVFTYWIGVLTLLN